MDVEAAAGFASLAAAGKIANNIQCRTRHAALYCLQGVIGCSSQHSTASNIEVKPTP